jgi:putative thioredoxin
MNELQDVYEVGAEDFEAQVVARSHTLPVLVDYWADWCAPCHMQMPVLDKLVADYAGQFVLAKVNTDMERELAQAHGIRSLPTLRLFRNGDMVEEIFGAQTESTLRALLERYIARPSDRQREAALESHRAGHSAEALRLLQSALAEDPGNQRIRLDMAAIQLETGEVEAARKHLEALPYEQRQEPEARRLGALLQFAEIAREAPPREELEQRIGRQPADSQSRYRLAARLVLGGEARQAMDELLYLIRHDRDFGDDAGRKSLLAVFDLLGGEGELVSEYRRKLATSMH